MSENINRKQVVWIFDIDGVITDPESKAIIYPEILETICERLTDNLLVAFNTGRSAEWLDKKVISFLRELVYKKTKSYFPLTNLVSICEMGNVIVKYDTDGEIIKEVLNESIIPVTLSKTIKEIVNKVYNKSMFVDETKEVILTIEMKDRFPYEEYKKRQTEFREEISIIMANYHPHLHVKPSSTTIAIDVKPVESGKNLGAEKILKWCKNHTNQQTTYSFICFGDSKSDLDMSDYFYLNKFYTEFVYVGADRNQIERQYLVHKSKQAFSLGTLEYLKSIKNT